jgi:hypothetical protein
MSCIHGKECSGVNVERRQLIFVSAAALAYVCNMASSTRAFARDEKDSTELPFD